MNNDHSVTSWIRGLKGGDEQAASLIWERFFERVCGLADRKLGSTPRGPRDSEDVALSAMDALYTGARDGRFAQFEDRSDLWDIVAMITIRKSIDARRRHGSRPEGPGAFALDAVPDPDSTDEEYVTALCATGEELVARIDEKLRPIALMRLEGLSNSEISDRIGRSVPTVERYLKRIRMSWRGAVQSNS